MKTQQQRVLEYIQDKGAEGAHPTNIIIDVGVTQYGARINELRNDFDCTHRNSDVCFATEHIINKKLENGTTVFVYHKTDNSLEKYRLQHIEEQKKLDKEDQQVGLFI